MNSLRYIQWKLNNGYILSYLSDDFYKSLKWSSTFNDIHKYDVLDFMSFDQRDFNYITGVIALDKDLLSLSNYSLALFPIKDYTELYLANNIELNINEELDNLELLYKSNLPYEDNLENLYNYIYNRFFNFNNVEVILFNSIITTYNKKNKMSILKPLLLTNCNHELYQRTVISYLLLLTNNLSNIELKQEDVRLITNWVLLVQDVLFSEVEWIKAKFNTKAFRDTNYILETVLVEYTLWLLNLEYTEDRNYSIIDWMNAVIKIIDSYAIESTNVNKRYDDKRYNILIRNISQYEKIIVAINNIK